MSRLRRYYYDNKNQIWKNILIVVSIFLVIQIVNYMIKNQYNSNNNLDANIEENKGGTNTVNNENIIVKEESLIDNKSTNKQTIKNNSKIIQEFFDFCFEGKMENAYNLLSNDCKEESYKSLGEFEKKYIENNFASKKDKVVNIENWTGNIYKTSITDDIMATGNIDNKSIQDYITVVTQNGEKKININSFIGKEEINKTVTKDNINITILSRKIYMEYEEYEIRVDNNTDNTILLDTKKSTKTMYLLDKNNIKYYSRSHEVLDGLLKINSGFSTQLEVKYTSAYSITTKIKSLVFEDVIMDYKEFLNGNIKGEKITIDF